MRVLIPPRGEEERFKTPKRSTFVIDDLIADGAILEVASREPDKEPLKFSFHNFVLSNVGSHGSASFQARLSNPDPPGDITTSGKFGPWNEDNVGDTPVSGEYMFQQADLGVFPGTARFSNLSFSVPGALAQMQGTYNLITEKIDLHGTLKTESEPLMREVY